jgi:predicted DNA-binding transcriptional regulator AlpA
MDLVERGRVLQKARVLRTAGAATYTGLTSSTLEKARLAGWGPPFIRLGARAVGYLVEDLDSWLESRKRSSTSDEGPRSA